MGHGAQRLGDRLRRRRPPRPRRGSRPSASGAACGRRPVRRSATPAPPSAPLSGSLSTTWSAPHAAAASAWCGWRASTVTGQRGKSPCSAASDGQPDDAGADDQHRVAVDGRGPQQAVARDGDRLVEAGAAVGDRVGQRVEHGVVGQHLSAQPPPRSCVNPSERPELTMRLSRLRHDDVQPRAQLAHGGSIPRGRHGMHGSMTTLVPTATEQSGPASTTRPAVSWPSTKGNVPMDARVGDGPVLWANRWRSLPQIPPVATSTRAHDGPGQRRARAGRRARRGTRGRPCRTPRRACGERRRGGRRLTGGRLRLRCRRCGSPTPPSTRCASAASRSWRAS